MRSLLANRHVYGVLRKVILAALLSAVFTYPALSGTRSLNELPAPVQSYILREAVEAGVENPANISTNPDYSDDFEFPGVKGSDLNSDGKRDYAVALCMFADGTPQFRTNGYPCAYGSLIISNGEGYSFIAASGFVVKAKASKPPIVIVRERQFNGECDDYVCDFQYALKEVDGPERFKLQPMKVCMPDQC